MHEDKLKDCAAETMELVDAVNQSQSLRFTSPTTLHRHSEDEEQDEA